MDPNVEDVAVPISKSVQEALKRASWIRQMFEQGTRLKEEFGKDGIFDFTLGNPHTAPPQEFVDQLRALANGPQDEIHRYMPNAGWPHVREKIAAELTTRTEIPYSGDRIVMTVGAGGALNVLLKSLLDPGDEVIILSPYFVEYLFYIANHGGNTVVVQTTEDFGLDAEALASAITERTRAVIINSPNNPTGRVYSSEELQAFCTVLKEQSERISHPIYLISDEPYRKILYPGFECPEIPTLYDDTIVITSHSKDLGLAGERIGYLAISSKATDSAEIAEACTFSNRTLGFVNAPSFFQLAIADCQGISVDLKEYTRNRELLFNHLINLGFECSIPGGAFFLFPASPIEDEVAFTNHLMEERILVVPGRGFGRSGYIRISYAIASETIERSLDAWERIASCYPQLEDRREKEA